MGSEIAQEDIEQDRHDSRSNVRDTDIIRHLRTSKNKLNCCGTKAVVTEEAVAYSKHHDSFSHMIWKFTLVQFDDLDSLK